MSVPVLQIDGLTIGFGATAVVRGVSLDLRAGRVQGLAGESGSGKTVTAMSVLGLLPRTATVTGSIRLGETELVGLRRRELSAVRGRRVAMVFQDPSASLHPQLTVGHQLTDHVRRHLKLSKAAARSHAVELLARVRVPDPGNALGRYPHQFSGGQRQRIAIAIALACDPEVLLADEPTTALDVTVQAGILHLLRDLAIERNLAVLLVTHDLGVMSAIADDVAVMRHGLIVESGTREQIFLAPSHEYTRALLAAMPDSAPAVRADAGADASALDSPDEEGTS
ncbi:ABC transporter ATP-binding protein [Cryobacterium sp. 1639]|jgi:peptide/nickel transport system ATP-binding protein|uniref:ABC transporter ATP-binding protein n=1 Tax=Cryobacterium inferilacus TaxID=2866629 RepID=UPI001C73745B|nr:ABC transporter ATP-binding protein [Cryobacterium sp. 1639]MBX0301969.1 ABC transporter ATP-binding protein [Cryobacterium sp. 1639]